MADTHQRFGIKAQQYAAQLLRVRKMGVKAMSYTSPFDLLLKNGMRIEVKAAHMNPTMFRWTINIHRHGKRREDHVDAYMILLDMRPVGKKKPLVLIVPAPVRKYTIFYTVEKLLTTCNWQVDNWSAIGVRPLQIHKKPPATENRQAPVKRYLSRWN